MLTNTTPRKGIPPQFKDIYVLRILNSDFGPNSNEDPMITVDFEIVGKPNRTGSIDTVVERNGVKFEIAGLKPQRKYFTLTEKAIWGYEAFYNACFGADAFNKKGGVDPENPDLEWLKDPSVLFTALLSVDTRKELKMLSDEEKAAGKKAHEAEPLLDEDGNEIIRETINISEFRKPFKGDVSANPM